MIINFEIVYFHVVGVYEEKKEFTAEFNDISNRVVTISIWQEAFVYWHLLRMIHSKAGIR